MTVRRRLSAPARRVLGYAAGSVLLSLGWASPAFAGCTVSAQTLTLTPATSYDVRGGTIPSVSGSAGLGCTGAALSVLGGSYARATVTSANAFRLTAASGDTIAYAASADSGGTQTFTQGGTIDYMNPTLLSLLGLLSSTSFNPPLYARLTSAPNIPAGTYTDRLTVVWDYSICNGVQVAGVCVLYERGRVTTTIDVTILVGSDCRISAPNIVFGSAPLASQFAPVSQSVLVDCTRGTSYKVAFTAGRNGSARPWRTMRDGAGHTLQYNLYRPDGVTIWDESNPAPSAVVGTGGTAASQAQPYVAQINPAQTTPPAGSYTDQLQVVVSF